MTPDTSAWLDAFFSALGACEVAESLKAASIDGRLSDWTRLLTTAVVQACEKTGWLAAAKGHRLELLPKVGQEYLGLDVMAFAPPPRGAAGDGIDEAGACRWPVPVAVFELENSEDDDRVAYSLWKVLCVRAPLRVVFAYRPDWETGRTLVHDLGRAVVGPLPVIERAAIGGETLVLLGSRGEGETFPHGFFKVWRLDSGVAVFKKMS